MYEASNHYGELLKSNLYVQRRMLQGLELIKPKIKNNSKILDIGGYMGDFLTLIKEDGIKIEDMEYHIVDYDETAMKIAQKRGAITHKIDFNFQDITDIFGKEKFDLIICTEVLEHLLDSKKHISKFKKLLRNDGFCLISLPNENTIFHRIFSLFGMGIDQCVFELYKHLHFPTVKQSEKFVSDYFKIEKKEYYINMSGNGSRLSWASGVIGIIPDIFWQFLANILPGLFARGTIFYLTKK